MSSTAPAFRFPMTSSSEDEFGFEIGRVFSKITVLRDNKKDPMALVLRHIVNSKGQKVEKNCVT